LQNTAFRLGEKVVNRIKEILKAQGRSQIWLADHIGKSYVVTTNYCNNKTQPKLSVLHKIAEVLEVDIRELLEVTRGPGIMSILTGKRTKFNLQG
jgi:putative transcriptional regulator